MSSSDQNSQPRQAGPKVFISYRRRFDRASARLLRLELTRVFGDDAVFRDVDDIAPGDIFPQKILNAVNACDTFLALISPSWLETAADLQNPGDFVRLEIAAALARKVKLIPLLLNGARMPPRAELPPDLGEL
ncbi:MAG: toll/interleukin-1 receptor domain-containing protein, partial [Pyrinomonadaceae bacterium]